MRTLIVYFIVLCTFAGQAQVPDWGWLRTASGSNDDAMTLLATDQQGNVYTAGNFNSSVLSVVGVTLSNSGTSSRDVFVAKYDKVGTAQWVIKIGGTGDELIKGLVVDPSGNIILAGNFDSPTLSVGTSVLNNSSGSTDIFFVKINPAGLSLWAAAYGGNLLEDVAGVCCDNAGNIFLSGTFRSLSFSFGAVGVINSGGSDGFLVKFSTGGQSQWARQMGGSGDEVMQGISTDGSAAIYIGGDFNSTVLATYGFTCQGQTDIFLAKYDLSNGNILGARQIGGSQADNLQALQASAAGEVYVGGSFSSPVLNLGSVVLNLGSSRDLLLIKISSTLQTNWANRYGGTTNNSFSAIRLDGSGIIASGYFSSSSLLLGTLSFTSTGNVSRGFIAGFTGSGAATWGLQTMGTGEEKVLALNPDNAGSYLLAGYYSGALSAGGQTLSATGLQDGFLARLCSLPAVPVLSGPGTICKNSSTSLSALPVSGINMQWYTSATATLPFSSGLNQITINTPGIYYALAQSSITGCYSPARAVISVTQPASPVVSVSGKTLSSSAATSFQWLRCDRDSVLGTQTSSSYTLSFSGYFAVATVISGCKDTSACVFYSVDVATGTITLPGDTIKVVTQLSEVAETKSWHFSPNPSSGLVQIEVPERCDIEVYALSGQIVRRVRLVAGIQEQDWSDLSPGCYLIRHSQTHQSFYFIRLP